jgi:hypothetical protein
MIRQTVFVLFVAVALSCPTKAQDREQAPQKGEPQHIHTENPPEVGDQPGARGQDSPSISVATRKESDGTRHIEVIVEGELSRRLAKADRWEVTVTATKEDRAAGLLPKIEVHGWNLRLPDGQVLAEVELTAQNVGLDFEQGTISSCGDVHALFRLRPDDLASFVEKKAKGKLRNVRFAIVGDQVDERFKMRAGPFWLKVHRVAMSHPDGSTVSTHARKLTVAGIRIPKNVLRRIERKINPIFDGSKLPVPVTVDEIGVNNGLLEASVSLDLCEYDPCRS